MVFYPHGEDEAEEDSYEEPLEDDERILRRYAKFKVFRRSLAIIAIVVFVGVFVAPELARHLRLIFTGPPSPDYSSLVIDLAVFAQFNPGVVHYEIEYDAQLSQELVESTFSQAAADWEGALEGLLDFEKAEEGEVPDLLIEIVEGLPRPGKAYREFDEKGLHYRPRVELNASDLHQPDVLRLVIAHELGHVLGIWGGGGHSDYPGDLMYPQPRRVTPSERDIRTIRIIYGLE